MNYKIIQNEQALQEFIDWLPDLKSNETLYVSLLARRKYNSIDSNLTADKNQLKRCTSTKDRLIEKIRQMECELGSYVYKGQAINQNNLALYITPNPRDLYKASLTLMKDICTELAKPEPQYSPQSAALNAIQVSCGSKVFYDIDVDFNKELDFETSLAKFKTNIIECINPEALTLIRTNGGLHCLVRLDTVHKTYAKSWYQKTLGLKCNEYDVTMNGDNLLPGVGTNQGANGFYPYFIQI